MNIIRSAEEQDLVEITAIYNEAVLKTTSTFHTEPVTLEERKRWLESHDSLHPVTVLIADSIVAGWASLSKWSDRPAYKMTVENSLYVKEDYRGKGFGTLLLNDTIKRARENGFHTVIARIAGDNEVSIRMHEKVGYVRIGIMKEVGKKFGKFIDVHLMQILL